MKRKMSFIQTQVFIVVEYMFKKCYVVVAIKENLECEKSVVDKI